MKVTTKRVILFSVLAALLLLALAAFFTVKQLQKPSREEPHVQTGSIDFYLDFPSRWIEPRCVSVWLPEGYETGEPCNVVYMHDGKMLFDTATAWNHKEWDVDGVAGRLIQEGAIPRCIVVGINSTEDRLNEYFPDKTGQYVTGTAAKSVAKQDFKGDAYLHFVVGELKPFIDEHYRPHTDREHTFILGSSMGGLISLYALCEYPEVFGGAGCMSSHLSFIIPSLGRGRDAWAQAFAAYLRDKLPEANSCRVYMDHGTKSLDKTYDRYQPVVDAIFREKGWDADHYRSLVFPGHSHTETDWSARLDQPLRFLCRQ